MGDRSVLSVRGDTVPVYLFVLRNSPCDLKDVQGALKLSSASMASYHLSRLVQAGVLGRTEDGRYNVVKDISADLLEGYVKFGRRFTPQLIVTVAFTGILAYYAYLVLTTPPDLDDIVAAVYSSSIILLWYETVRLRMRKGWRNGSQAGWQHWWLETRRRAVDFVDVRLLRYPHAHSVVRWIFGNSKWIMFRCKWWLADFFNRNIRTVDLDKTPWLSPEEIVYSSLREFDFRRYRGAVIGGDWDQVERKFEDSDVYVAFKQVLVEGGDWTETAFYRHALDRISSGETLWGCADENDLMQRCKGFERLYESMRNTEYKSQLELLLSRPRPSDLVEVAVSIGRYGDLLLSNGAPRLAIAKLLGVKRIPVKIAVRHRGWMTLRVGLLQYAKTLGGVLYQRLTHPDLMDIPAAHECEDRYSMIRRSMSAREGCLLDIGSNFGYFCHRFEDDGFECYAVENFKETFYWLKKLRRAENRRFKIVTDSILEWRQVNETHFDVVLALNVFYRFLRTKELYEKLIALLKNLQMGELFFETPNIEETEEGYRRYSPSDFVALITQVSRLKRAELIGEAPDGRQLYRLY